MNSKIKCRQAPRNQILPASCKQDLFKYKESSLFAHSTCLADKYCSNLTLVLRNQVKEQRSNTKADKNLQKSNKKAHPTFSKLDTQPLDTGSTSDAKGPSTG